jgi:hypothetical protein
MKQDLNTLVVGDKTLTCDENTPADKARLFSHVRDLTRKIDSFEFNLEQLHIGRNSAIELFLNTD